MGLPVIVGRGGLLRVVELKLDEKERAELVRSAQSVRAIIAGLTAAEGVAESERA